jgi:hypothetical protein
MTVSNDRKNLTRLAGEFLVASRLTQRGYMVALQWGTTIGYDILVFDKQGHVAFLEVKTTASHKGKWILQKKFANPAEDKLSLSRRFICCVDLTTREAEPSIYVFPAAVVARALHYFYDGRFSKSDSYVLPLASRPRGKTRDDSMESVGEHISCEQYLERYDSLGVDALLA